MRKYFKQLLALSLCICMFATALPVEALTEEPYEYRQGVVERYWESFEIDGGAYYQNLINKSDYGYTRWADAIDSKGKISHAFLWATNFLLDKQWDTKAYTSYLTTIMTMLNQGFEDSVLSQASYTIETNAADFGQEVLELSLEQFLGAAKVKKLNKTIQEVMGAHDLATLGAEAIKDPAQLYIYSLASASYDKKKTVLDTLVEYSEDKKLKEAAQDALKVADLEFIYILSNYKKDFYKDVVDFALDVNDVKLAKELLPLMCTKVSKNLVPWLLKHVGTDAAVGTLMVSEFVKKYAAGIGLFVEAGLLTGKFMSLFVGDQAEMFREMKVMDAISDALTGAIMDYNNQIAQSSGDEQYDLILKYVAAGEALSYTHMRGEYCMAEVDKMQGENAAVAEKYVDQLSKKLNDGYEILEKILVELEITDVVSEKFQLKDGFIKKVKQLKSVPEDYIGIYDYADLEDARNHPDKNYILMNDIQCQPYDLPINCTFTGVLDGNGYEISSMNNTLFAVISGGTIKNLGMQVDAAIVYQDEEREGVAFNAIGEGYWGGLACIAEESVIDNCYVKGSIYLTEEEEKAITACVGALIGMSNLCEVTNCYNQADVTFDYNRGIVCLGGLLGKSQVYFTHKIVKDFANIENCFNEGELVAKSVYSATAEVGGICGSDNRTKFTSCYNTADITAYDNESVDGIYTGGTLYAGGICGAHAGEGNVYACWNTGNIKSQSETPVLETKENGNYYIDPFSGEIFAGGIIGYAAIPNLRKCMNAGGINGRSYSGGIIGAVGERGWIMDAYNTGAITGNYLAGGIVGIGGTGNGTFPNATELFIENCYTTGVVSTEAVLGGQFAGYLAPGVECGYCFCVANGQTDITGINSETSDIKEVSNAQILLQETYEGYDFAEMWTFDEESMTNPVKLRF